ncbi:MAG: flagellar basal body P-ring formation protein FlgA [Helicobacteraceae bacterium]|nr:flagellar basal body P-ring formation protein FlgA [Helicobacteraceae bacterium]
MAKFVLLILFNIALFAEPLALKESYFFSDHKIKVNDIFNDLNSSSLIYQINRHKTKVRVKSKVIIKAFKALGIDVKKSSKNYVTFYMESKLDLEFLKLSLANYYKRFYNTLQIDSIQIAPRSFTAELPEVYKIEIPNNSFKRSTSTFYIESDNKKRIFFNYTIKATIGVFRARDDIKRGTRLELTNIKKDRIALSQVKVTPIQSSSRAMLEARRHIRAEHVITKSDVRAENLVVRNQFISAVLREGGLSISFDARSTQEGALGDNIMIIKPDGSKIRATVIGEAQVEVK